MKQVVAVVQRGEGDDKKRYWTKIGVAFANRDGSHNLRSCSRRTLDGRRSLR
jgi:hypothetical protein